jgi:acetyltransferase-like isoleucine patch superfamily enzyme
MGAPKIASTAIVSKRASIGEDTIVQDYAIIEEDCVIGKSCRIGYHAVLRRGTGIGNQSIFGTHSVSEGKNSIGSRTTIHSQCHITAGVVIEDRVFIAPFFCGANTPRIVHGRKYPLVLKPYRVKFGARIAICVTVLPDVTIGREALIGAGSLVTSDIPDFAVAYGRPAKVVRYVTDEERLKAQEDRTG